MDTKSSGPKKSDRSSRTERRALLALTVVWPLLALVFSLQSQVPAAAASPSTTPTVNGLFYGDGDNARYVLLNESYAGSDLYAFYDAPSTTLFVALVVDRSVNENVFGASAGGYSGNYMGSAGWGNGGGQQRGANVLVDSEFAGFEFACAPGSPSEWDWQQGYACQDGALEWVSDTTCGTSAPGANGYPPSLVTASSFAWNINTYEAVGTKPWNRDIFGTAIGAWKSPFSDSDPNTVPPNNPNTVIGLEGYPEATVPTDLSQGPNIGFNSTYQWEWPMVYEWSLDLGPGGTNCGANSLYLVSGLSHHSPMKEGTGAVGNQYEPLCGEENDCFPPTPGGPAPFADWGDLPDTYSTISSTNGAKHELTANGPYLGSTVLFEADGNPTGNASGDGSEEDGVTRGAGTWAANQSVGINFDVQCPGTNADIALWIDWDGSNAFEADEYYFFLDRSCGSVHNESITINSDYTTGNSVYVRTRIFGDVADAPGGSLDSTDFAGVASGGEVEDYQWTFSPTSITLQLFDTSAARDAEWILLFSLVLLACATAMRVAKARRRKA